MKRGIRSILVVALVFATMVAPSLALAQTVQSFGVAGQRPFVRLQGLETSGGTVFIGENAGEIQFGSITGATQIGLVQTTPPTCTTNCGTTPPAVLGSDSAGIITMGTTPATAFVLNFNATWSAAPACVVTQQTSAANYVTKAIASTTTLTISTAAGPSTSDKFSYICQGVQ